MPNNWRYHEPALSTTLESSLPIPFCLVTLCLAKICKILSCLSVPPYPTIINLISSCSILFIYCVHYSMLFLLLLHMILCQSVLSCTVSSLIPPFIPFFSFSPYIFRTEEAAYFAVFALPWPACCLFSPHLVPFCVVPLPLLYHSDPLPSEPYLYYVKLVLIFSPLPVHATQHRLNHVKPPHFLSVVQLICSTF